MTAFGSLIGGTFRWLLAAVAVMMTVASALHSERIALRVGHARALLEADAPEVHASVRELAARAGIPMPALFLVGGEKPNGFALGRTPNRAVVAMTEPLLADLPFDQVRGAVAHELAHIRNRDILVSSIAGAITLISNVAAPWLLFGTEEGKHPTELGAWLAVVILVPLGGALLRLAVSRRREYLADATAARLLGEGAPLAEALHAIEDRWGSAHNVIRRGAQGCVVGSLAGGRLAGLFSTHPPTRERILRLRTTAAFGPPVSPVRCSERRPTNVGPSLQMRAAPHTLRSHG